MKTILVGFDAFDPMLFERLHADGKTPNLSKFVDLNGYTPFRVTNPPQSEVSWTSIATGLNPGGHGIFDFVHRNPETYGLFVSLLPTKSGLLGTQFSPPHNAETIFDAAVKDGFPATSLWWPVTFPARLQSPVRTIPGLGTPDIFGQLGVGVSYSAEPIRDKENLKTRTAPLIRSKPGVYQGTLNGPVQQSRSGDKPTETDFELTVIEDQAARLTLGKRAYDLQLGKWSAVIEINFKVGFLVSLKIVTRVIVTQVKPDPVLYFLPLQIHPLGSPWPYGTPKGMLKNIWKNQARFLTLGWPQDTTALEEGFINDAQFLDLCEQIFAQRERILMSQIDAYQEGVLASVFDSLDRVQHMFWKNRPDIVEAWYLKLDAFAGRIQEKLGAKPDRKNTKLLFISDHGFQNYDYKVNINRWLIEQGYLKLKPDEDKQNLSSADWHQSQAYAIGLNSLYLNLKGREGQGFVSLGQKVRVLEKLRTELLQWEGPDHSRVVQSVLTNAEAFDGPLAEHGPDLVIGYAPKYRASSETGLGGWSDKLVVDNPEHWEADHCMDANAVPGVLFANQGLDNFPSPSYADIPALSIGKQLKPGKSTTPVGSDEDQDALEERLKGLGYL